MKLGITERGDAALDLSWRYRLGSVDGCILITKEITDEFIRIVIEETQAGTKLIVHCTCTGWGQTEIEPNVPSYQTQLKMLKKLLDEGFPAERAVLRIDPIIPTKEGVKKVEMVLQEAQMLELLPDIRVRISILDEYYHVKDRFRNAGKEPMYGSSLYAPMSVMMETILDISWVDGSSRRHHG